MGADRDQRIRELELELATLRAEQGDVSANDATVDRLLHDRLVFESLPHIVAITDRQLKILYLNRTLSGIAPRDRVGQDALTFIPPEHRTEFCDTFEKAWLAGEPHHLRLKTVSHLWWEGRLAPIKEAGVVVVMLVTIADVTERVRAEVALRESESRLRHALEATGMGTWTWDSQTNVVEWDPLMCKIWGIPHGTAPRTYEGYIATLHPDDRERVDAAIRRYLETAEYLDIEHRILRPDGEVRYVLAKATITRTAGALFFRGGLFDVTERKRLEEQLRQVQKMEAIGQLTAGIAHNFNNVLSIILPNVALCQMEADPRFQDRLADIEHASNRAAELVRQLMLFARPDTRAQRSALDLVAACRRTVDICRTTFGPRIAIDLETAPDLPAVLANAGQIDQVLLNVCLNARDALEAARCEFPTIQIAVDSPSEGMVRVRVTDNGVGMAESVRARVFEPFFTTKEVGRGTGLGLASAYAIVRDHEGEIRCRSVLGEGTTFEIELPSAFTKPLATREVHEPARASFDATVLLIDDEPLVRRALRGTLERAGYRVLEAIDGVEGLRAFESARKSIDAIILDRSMPRLSGDQVLARLSELGCQAPVILLSGHPDILSGSDQAAVVLAKPADSATLLSELGRSLEARRLAHGARRPHV